MNTNPYRAPREEGSASEEVVSRPTIRWRMIPAGLCGAQAIAVIVTGLATGAEVVSSALDPMTTSVSRLTPVVKLAMTGTSLVGTVLWSVAAVAFWKRRWIVAVICLLFGLAGVVVLDWLPTLLPSSPQVN